MLKNYLKIAFRIIKRQRLYSVINITGLAVGMACFILIFLYVQDELSFDRYHENSDKIYRITVEGTLSGETAHTATSQIPLGPALVNDYPEVLNFVRFYPRSSVLIGYGEKKFYETRFYYTDPSVFDVFTFPLIRGNPKEALQEPYSIVITEEMAEKYFGDEDPLGKALTLNNQDDYKIDGVVQNVRPNSHFRFDFLASFNTLIEQDKNLAENWGDISFYTYVLLAKDFPPSELEKKFPDIVKKYVGTFFERYMGDIKDITSMFKYHLQPLKRIHLHSHLMAEIEANSDVVYVYVFSSIAFFILMIACINFMNLSTARSSVRAKEVGMRKVVGANRVQLMRQFLGEFLLLSFVALLFALLLVEIFLPAFNVLSGRKLALTYSSQGLLMAGLLGMALFVGLISGSYAAFFLSAFKPVEVLKGMLKAHMAAPVIRKGLVVFQFSISIILIIGTLVVHSQLSFIKSKKLGFDKEHVAVIRIRNKEIRSKYEAIKNEFLQHSNIIKISASSGLPGKGLHVNMFHPEGAHEEEFVALNSWSVDHDFIEALGIELKEGRNFSVDFIADEKEAFILNEAAVEKVGWKTPIGKGLSYLGEKKGRVIGIVKDFHFNSLHQIIEPLVLEISPEYFHYISVRIHPQNLSRTLGFMENKWRRLAPGIPFEYSFLDEDFDKLYKAEKKLSEIFLYFSFLAVFIACLGLFGLASFTTERRIKEIGIRKILGASVSNIVTLLSREFIKWVAIANIIAWPIAYYVMNRWLQNFAYRTDIEIWVFLTAALSVIVIAWVTMSFQAVKAALSNPAKALRYE